MGKLSCRRRYTDTWRSLSGITPSRHAGADRRSFGGPDAAADGDGMAWKRPDGCARTLARHAGFRAGGSHPLDPPSAALRCARQASNRCARIAFTFKATRSRTRADRPLSRSFDDVDRVTEWIVYTGDRRAFGFRTGT